MVELKRKQSGSQPPFRAGVVRQKQAADVLCVPSKQEGVPNVILEAFACGLRTVATRVGGIPEVLD
jgi:glycosyltransferase involved in cell wall biosynthesis